MAKKYREAWLQQAATTLRKRLKGLGADCPEVYISVGFPKGVHSSSGGKAIGQCWSGAAVADGRPAIFISPELTKPARVLDVLLHELIHASTPGAGHRAAFSQLAAKAGLEKPWVATTASPELRKDLTALAKRLGKYHHAGVSDSTRKRQTTRMLKVQCAYCGYTVRTTRQWLDQGLPSCPEGDEMTEA